MAKAKQTIGKKPARGSLARPDTAAKALSGSLPIVGVEAFALGREERFRLIADSLPGPLSYVDMSQCYGFSNKAHEEWFGVPREQLKGRHVRDIIGPAAYETVKPYIEKALEGERTSFEGYIAYEAGRRFVHIDYVPTSDHTGQVDGFFVYVRDLTPLKMVEEQFRALVESAPDAMIAVNAEGEITVVNQQAEQLFGYTREEMLGQQLEMLVPAAVVKRHVALRREYLKNPTARPMGTGLELYGVRKDGSTISSGNQLESDSNQRGRGDLKYHSGYYGPQAAGAGQPARG